MKLEIKYLIGYLPFDVEIYYSFYSDPTGEGGGYDRGIIKLNLNNIDSWVNSSCEIKPILHPLTDLKKSEFSNLVTQISRDVEHLDYKEVEQMEFRQVSLLMENKFDVFGLIQKGLAININEIHLLKIKKNN